MEKESDISDGGVFIKTESPVDISSELDIRFKYHTLGFLMHGKVVHERTNLGNVSGNGYGIAFNEIQKVNQKNLVKLIRVLEILEFPRRPKRREWRKDFWSWSVKLFTTGIGVTPDLSAKYLRQRS